MPISDKTIWSFWHSGSSQLSPLHRLCVASWRANNPGWDIRIIDRNNVYSYVPPSELPVGWEQIETPQHQADAARLAVLKRYGGVYIDISVILLRNLDTFLWQGLVENRYGYFGFYDPEFGLNGVGKEYVVVWFMATQKGNPFIARWHEVFCQLMANRSSVDNISQHPLLRDIETFIPEKYKNYLAMQALLKRLIDTEPAMRSYWQDKFKLLDCFESGFKWRVVLDALDWYAEDEMDGLIRPNPPESQWTALQNVPLFKLNNVGGRLNSCIYDELLHSDNVIARIFSKALDLEFATLIQHKKS